MSVIVATAYMEEAERFAWLVAMDAGKVLAIGTPAELRSRTGSESLDAAFIALLPEEARRQPPRRRRAADCRRRPMPRSPSRPRGLTKRFGDFVAVDRRLPHPARRNLRLPRLQRLRQVDDDEDAHRSCCRPAKARLGCSARRWMPRDHRHPPPRGLHVAGLLALWRIDGAPESGAARASVPVSEGQIPARVDEMLARFGLGEKWTACPRTCRWASASACRWRSPWCTSRSC
jgi:hypothetical protein